MKRLRSGIKEAFTLLEVVVVIAILGIVTAIGADIIANVYEQYIIQRAQYKAAIKTELASLEIANRLRYAIPGTVYRIKNDGTKEPIVSPMSGNTDDYMGIQWVGYDREGFEYTPGRPGWSGFCDLDLSGRDFIKTPGSNLSALDTIKSNLGGGANGWWVYFADDPTPNQVQSFNSSYRIINLTTIPSTQVRHLTEQYKMAWSSYAVIVQNGQMRLYHHLPARSDYNITLSTDTYDILLNSVTAFKFKGSESTIRFKICKTENISMDTNITTCKEKAVF